MTEWKDLPGGVHDEFYQYGPLRGDARCTDNSTFHIDKEGKGVCGSAAAKVGYFGNKVLAVSYGGTLKLAGYKGATYDGQDKDPLNSGWSWIRLADGHSLQKGATSLTLERDPAGKWGAGDELVVTTTDYVPGHSEKLAIDDKYKGGATVGFRAVESPTGKIQWPHSGTRYGGPNDADDKRWAKQGRPSAEGRLPERLQASMNWDLVKNGAETRRRSPCSRAASRSCRPATRPARPWGRPTSTAPTWSSARASSRCRSRASSSGRWGKAAGWATIPSTSTWRGGRRPTPT